MKGSKRSSPTESLFTAINASSVKTVADRHKLAALHNNFTGTADELSESTNIDDLK